jgi:DNA-binding SARP family transcriptional activator
MYKYASELRADELGIDPRTEWESYLQSILKAKETIGMI